MENDRAHVVAETVFRAIMRHGTPKYLYGWMIEGMCREHGQRLYPDLADEEIAALTKAAVLLVNDYIEAVAGYSKAK